MTTKIILTDTFNNRVLSRHRTIEAAVKASRRHARAVERRNGKGSYIPTSITSSDGADIYDEVMQAKMELDTARR